ncbi:MAG: hypothetical protein AAF849_03375 [Bacteroidota bacterium]
MQKLPFYLILLFFASCASPYHSLQLNRIDYEPVNEGGAVEYSYRYDAMQAAGNKKIARKEDRRDVHLVAFQFKNNTNRTLVIGEDVQFYANRRMLYPLKVNEPYRALKQHPWTYALYLPLVLNINLNNNDSSNGLTIPIGLGIGTGNIIVSAVANKKFAGELFDNYLLGKSLRPGESKSGLLASRVLDFTPMKIELEEEKGADTQ